MAVAKLQTSFNSGEISPELFARPELQLHKMGAATLKNWVAKTSGAAQLRPGFEHVASLPGKTRMIPFRLDGNDMVIAMRAGKFTFYEDGLPVSSAGGVNDVFKISNQASPGSIDLSTNTLTFDRSHDFQDLEEVVVESSGAMPGGVATVFDYEARPQGPRGLQLKYLTNDPISITSTGSGELYVWKKDQLPRDYQIPLPLADTGGGATPSILAADADRSIVRLTNAHGFQKGDIFTWTKDATGSSPATQSPGNPFVGYDGRGFEVDTVSFDALGSSSASTANDLIAKQAWYLAYGLNIYRADISSNRPFANTVYATRRYLKGTVLYLRSSYGSPDFSAGDYIVARYDLDASLNGPRLADGWELKTDVEPWLTLSNDYAEDDLFEITYAQTEKKIRLAHRDYPTLELTRSDDGTWTSRTLFNEQVSFAASVSASPGAEIGIANAYDITTSPNLRFTLTQDSGLGPGDLLYVSDVPNLANGFYVCGVVNGKNIETIVDLNGSLDGPSSNSTNAGTIIVADSTAKSNQRYIVTAVDDKGQEFNRSTITTSVFNLLQNAEAFNTISWAIQEGASAYRIYKEEDGIELFGFIAETGAVSFEDRNIEPDFGRLAPELDTTLVTNPPAAVAFYDQRGVFGGTNRDPQKLLLSSVGRDSDLVSRLIPLDDDRISLQIASREGQTIRHIVPVSELLIFTDTCEWALTTKNTDTLTPSSATIRLQTTVGSNYVRPQVLNNSVLFSSKSNHVHRMSYQLQENGFGGLDLSTKAGHLFDDYVLTDSASQTSRLPVAWYVNSAGWLLGLTYSQEEKVSGWHRHHLAKGMKATSVAVATEGAEDRLYMSAEDADGNHVLLRWGIVNITGVMDTVHLDNARRTKRSEESAATLTITGSNAPGSDVRVTASAPAFDVDCVGEQLFVTDLGLIGRIKTRTSRTEVVVTLIDKGSYKASSVTSTSWGVTVSQERVPYLSGSVDALLQKPDGTVNLTTVNVVDGVARLPYPCRAVHLGHKFDNELRTLPASLQIEAAGIGRLKSVDRVDVQLFETAGLSVGPDADTQSSIAPESLTLTSELKTETVEATWSPDGQVSFVQKMAVPATVAGVTLNVNLGG